MTARGRVELFDEAAVRLKRVVPFDGACWHTLDPGSNLITQHRLQELPDRFEALADNEYAAADVNKFEQLAKARRKAATLYSATDGHPEQSARFRNLLTPAGVGPELRAAFVADGACWGALILVRQAGRSEFTDRECALLERSSALFARAVRRGLVIEASGAASAADPPGMIEMDADGEAARVSASAEPLLLELSGTTVEEGIRAAAVQTVVSATRSMIKSGGSPGMLPRVTVKTPAGTWLVVHGGLLGPADPDTPVVFLQRAHPTLVAPLLLQAYGLTVREQEVAQLLLRGATSAQIATRLHISPHTANDHTKSIFEKAGASTRGELSATLFFGEHLPRIQNRVSLGDDASFVDAPRSRGKPD